MNINITDDKIEYKVARTYIDNTNVPFTFVFLNKVFTRQELVARNDFSDYTVFGVYIREQNLANLNTATELFDMAEQMSWSSEELKSKIRAAFGNTFSDSPLSAIHFVNITALTLPTRNTLDGLRNIVSGTRLIQMFFPTHKTTFTNAPVTVAIYPGMEIISNMEQVSIDSDKILVNDSILKWTSEHTVIPTIELDGGGSVAPDKTRVIDVYLKNKFKDELMTDSDLTLYIEHINGYVPYTRIDVDKDGTCQIPVMALGMKPGDEIRLKVGFKYYPSVADITIPVI